MVLRKFSLYCRFSLLIVILSFGGLPLATHAAPNSIKDIFVVDKGNVTKVIFNLPKQFKFDAFRLNNPDRIVVDLNQSRLKSSIPTVSRHHNVIKNIRSAKRKNKAQRFVIDTRGKVDYSTYRLKPNKDYGYRLVVELTDKDKKPVKAVKKVNVTKSTKANTKIKNITKNVTPSSSRDIVIAIDAGHGGQDPGAIGKHGTHEKDVVLRIAKKMKHLIDKQPGMRATLVRSDDRFIPLRDRMKIARKAKADMFISVHADAYRNRNVKGSSVYVLSERGASDEAAKWLADQENAADLVGGVSLDDKDATLAKVLLDLSQTATIEASSRVADDILTEIRRVAPVHNSSVQHARFVVLKSPDIPSVLVETAFISNPREERRLNNEQYQNKLAKAMLKGIKRYFEKNPLPDTLEAQRRQKFKVKPGDTLSNLAQKHKVTVAQLMSVNNLKSDKLYAGQTLRIPF